MISKREIMETCFGLMDEVDDLYIRIDKLDKEINKIKSCSCGKNVDGVKRKPGRPRKQK